MDGVQHRTIGDVSLGSQYGFASSNIMGPISSLPSPDQSNYHMQLSNDNSFNSNRSNSNDSGSGKCGSSGSMVGIGSSPSFPIQSNKSWMQMARDRVTLVGTSATAAAAARGSSSSNSGNNGSSNSTNSTHNLNGTGNWLSSISTLSHSSDLLSSPTFLERNSGDDYLQNTGHPLSVSQHCNSTIDTYPLPSYSSAGNSADTSSCSASSAVWCAGKNSCDSSSSFANGTVNMHNSMEGIVQKSPTVTAAMGMPVRSQLMLGSAGLAASDGEYERALVSAVCSHGGLKATPSEEALYAFLCTARVLSPDTVGMCLLEQLNSDHWQSRNKALVVIESFFSPISSFKSNSSDDVSATGCIDHAQWWCISSNADALQSMLVDSKASVRAQASRTARAVGTLQNLSMTTPLSSVSPMAMKDIANDSADVGRNSNLSFQPLAIIPREVSLIDWDDGVDDSDGRGNIIAEEEDLADEARKISLLLGMGVEEHRQHANPKTHHTTAPTLTAIYQSPVSSSMNHRDISSFASCNDPLLDRSDVDPLNSTCATGGDHDIFAGLTVTSSSFPAPSLPSNPTPFPTYSPLLHTVPISSGFKDSSTNQLGGVLVDSSNCISSSSSINCMTNNYDHSSYFNSNCSSCGSGRVLSTDEGFFFGAQLLHPVPLPPTPSPPLLSHSIYPHSLYYTSSSIYSANSALCPTETNSSISTRSNSNKCENTYDKSHRDGCNSSGNNAKSSSISGFSFNVSNSSTPFMSNQLKYRDSMPVSHELPNSSQGNMNMTNPKNDIVDVAVDSFSFLSDVLKSSSETSAASQRSKR